jgi:hypothetical protein
MRIAFLDRDGDGERHDQQAATHAFIDGAQVGLMVAGDNQLMCRLEIEEVLPHEPAGEFVLAGQCFDFHRIEEIVP